jgi:parvulin-like peptidyl-prolyl isomerase
VPYARFEKFLRHQVGEGAGGLDSKVLSKLFDQFLGEELLVHLAVDERKLAPGASPRDAAEALLGAAADAPLPERDIRSWYEGHRAEWTLPERVHLRHILVFTAEAAQAAQKRIERGEDFAKVAREVSGDPGAPAGGDQGEIALDDLPLPFVQPVSALEPGETSAPIQASDGWHLFQVVSRSPERLRPLDEVSPEIEARLRRDRADALMAQRIAEAADRYNVLVYAQNLPFDYRGDHSRDDQGDASK